MPYIVGGYHSLAGEDAGEGGVELVEEGLLGTACDDPDLCMGQGLEIAQEFVCSLDGEDRTEGVKEVALLLIDGLDALDLFLVAERIDFGRVSFELFSAEEFFEYVQAGSSFLSVTFFRGEREEVTACYFVPSLCVVGHGVEEGAVHIKKVCFVHNVAVLGLSGGKGSGFASKGKRKNIWYFDIRIVSLRRFFV